MIVEQAEPGLVVTFYSYKGGVGRSMALANVAALLAQRGRRVLAIDWDLEAPGLEKFFENEGRAASLETLSARRCEVPGVVDLVHAYKRGAPLDWHTCLLEAEPARGVRLKLISAGQDTNEYPSRVRGLSWQGLFDEQDFGTYLEKLRDEWTREFDFVLVDSRTGLTDVGGICTIHLPDVLVTLFTTNHQGLAGVRRVMEQARTAQQSLPFDRSRLLLLPVPGRDDGLTEHEKAREWREIFARDLGPFFGDWLPRDMSPRDVLERLKLPYKPYWSFGERLPSLVEGTADPASLGHAYRLLADLIENRLDWKATIDPRARVEELTTQVRQVKDASERELRVVKAAAEGFAKRTRRLLIVAAATLVAIIAFAIYWRHHLEQQKEAALAAVELANVIEHATSLAASAATTDDPLETALLIGEIPLDVPHGTLVELVKPVATLASKDGFAVPSVVLRHTSAVTVAEFSPDGKHVATGTEDGKVRIWSTDGHGAPQSFNVATSRIERLEWSRDGGRILALCEAVLSPERVDPNFPAFQSVLLSLRDGTTEELRPGGIVGDEGGSLVSDGRFAADDSLLLSGLTAPLHNTMWRRAAKGGPWEELGWWERGIRRALFSVGKPLLVLAPDGLRRAGKNGLERLGVPNTHGAKSLASVVASVSPTGLVVAERDSVEIGDMWPDVERIGSVRIWRWSDAKENYIELTYPAAGLTGLVFGPRKPGQSPTFRNENYRLSAKDEPVVTDDTVSIVADDTIYVYHLDDKAVSSITSTKFSRQDSTGRDPDEIGLSPAGTSLKLLGTGGVTPRVWNADGKVLVDLRGHTGDVVGAEFDLSGQHVVTYGRDGTARIWATTSLAATVKFRMDALRSTTGSPDPTQVIDILRSATTACLTPDQRTRYLKELSIIAQARYEACERSYERVPLTSAEFERLAAQQRPQQQRKK